MTAVTGFPAKSREVLAALVGETGNTGGEQGAEVSKLRLENLISWFYWVSLPVVWWLTPEQERELAGLSYDPDWRREARDFYENSVGVVVQHLSPQFRMALSQATDKMLREFFLDNRAVSIQYFLQFIDTVCRLITSGQCQTVNQLCRGQRTAPLVALFRSGNPERMTRARASLQRWLLPQTPSTATVPHNDPDFPIRLL